MQGSAIGCDFNPSMQHLLETVLPGFQAREFYGRV
jgi:hypothetical protein